MACTLFDHKTIRLDLGKFKFVKNEKKLSNNFLESEILGYALEVTAIRTYLLSVKKTSRVNRERVLGDLDMFLGREITKNDVIRRLIREYFDWSFENASKMSAFDENLDGGKLREIHLHLTECTSLQEIEFFEKNKTDSDFFEKLTIEIKKTGIWVQQKLFSISRESVKQREKKLEQLKLNYTVNYDAISVLEKQLQNIRNEELKGKLKNLKVFECLNAEKASPHFLNIAKKTKTDDSTDIICDENGLPFANSEKREEHILKFYSELYKKDNLVAGSIEDYLGETILRHPLVRASKLTQGEKDILDLPLTFDEVEKSLTQVNMRSSPGIDGYSYVFIRKFWHIFGKPFFNCAVYALETGDMPKSFLSAQIKLIPKKGDLTKIKNWRPISLLSNFYKILSRAINNRLKKIVNRVLSRGQKGFNQSRQIHEVIINSVENMHYCSKNNIKGAMLSVDMSKAFDSVSHSYMQKVYKFFGFGDRIISWLKAIGTNRKAYILLSNNKLSEKSIILERGTAQGDSPSPFLYNLSAQILIWKIELDNQIEGIYPDPGRGAAPGPGAGRDPAPGQGGAPAGPGRGVVPGPGPGPVPGPDPGLDAGLTEELFAYESNKETNKNESFADDSSNFVKLKYDTILALKNALILFRYLSGLECNVEKSFIMRIGNLEGDIPQNILDLGFPFTNEVTILGFVLHNSVNIVAKNYEKVLKKITNIIRFWERFNLSFPGKICVYKTLLIPQINYIATVITPDDITVSNLSREMEAFVLKGLNISKKKIFLSAEEGGIGMFNLTSFIAALQVSWIRRASGITNDNWKVTLKNLGQGNVLNCVKGIGNEANSLIIENILRSFKTFKLKFDTYENNYINVPIFDSELFGTGRNQSIKFDADFFGIEETNRNGMNIKNVTWGHMETNGSFCPFGEFNFKTGIAVSREKFTALKNAYSRAKRKYHTEGKLSMGLAEFFVKNKKGSKRFRKVMDYSKADCHVENLCQIKSFCKASNTNLPDRSVLDRIALYQSGCLWNKYFFNNRLKVFLFKYYNNTLGTGNRVLHFNPTVDGACVFCSAEKILPPPLESFAHVFFDCPVVNKIIGMFFDKYFIPEFTRYFYFHGLTDGSRKDYIATRLVMDCLRYCIWQCRLEKSRLAFFTIEIETIELLTQITGASKKINTIFDNCNLLCKDGRAAEKRGGGRGGQGQQLPQPLHGGAGGRGRGPGHGHPGRP